MLKAKLAVLLLFSSSVFFFFLISFSHFLPRGIVMAATGFSRSHGDERDGAAMATMDRLLERRATPSRCLSFSFLITLHLTLFVFFYKNQNIPPLIIFVLLFFVVVSCLLVCSSVSHCSSSFQSCLFHTKQHKYGAACQAAVIKRLTQQHFSQREGQTPTSQIAPHTFRVAQKWETLESNHQTQLHSSN